MTINSRTGLRAGEHGAIPQLHDYLEASAHRLPGKVALVSGARRLTYAEVDAEANRLANGLVERGVGRGDRVLILAEGVPETVIAFWAALKANAVACPVSPLVKAPKLAALVEDCAPAALVASGTCAALLQAADRLCSMRSLIVLWGQEDSRPGALHDAMRWEDLASAGRTDEPPPRANIDVDLASLIYTSGSTGEPKGIMLTHRNMLTAAASITAYLEAREDDVVLDALPLSFDYGLYQVIMAFRMGATVVLERSFAYPGQVLADMMREGVTVFPGVPTMFATLAGMNLAGCDFSRIRTVTNTAAAIALPHVEFIRRTFSSARFYSMYGLTECKRCSYLPPEDLDRKPGSVGLAIPNTELWIVDERGDKVGPGVVGELVIRGATVMKGYWNKPEATAERLRPGPVPGELVLYTGDLCRLDEDGYLYFVARMDDVIKTRGEKVAPNEVEAALLGIAGIREAAVVGIPDTILGQAVKAFVVLQPGSELTPAAMRLQCQARLEPHMVPAEIVVVPALPRTSSMKINKRELL